MTDELRQGMKLGNYELLVPIGRGGMATVWVARIAEGPERGSRVAVKVMLAALAGDPEFLKMFVDEGRLGRRIRHPNVARVHDVLDHFGTPYIAMEWIEGESLHALLTETARRRLIAPEMAVSLVAKVAAGLELAHELKGEDGALLGVVHRDVSPHNILIGVDGAVKLVDFGVAKARGRLAEVTSAGQLKGKFGYMSPEQATDRPVDRRSDTFSLGIVLFELTTGKRLFRGRNDAETLRLVTSAQIPRPTSIASAYPKRLERIVLKALERDPVRRFQSAALFQHELESYLERIGASAQDAELADLLEQVFGDRIRQRRAQLDAAEVGLDSPRFAVASSRPAANPLDLLPESSRTPLNSSSEIEAPARGALGFAIAFGTAALVLAAGLSLVLRWFSFGTTETPGPALARVSLPEPAIEAARWRLAQKPHSSSAAGDSCANLSPQAPPGPSARPARQPAHTQAQDGAKVRGLR